LRTAIVCILARCEQSELPEENLSRYIVRPGSQGLTLDQEGLDLSLLDRLQRVKVQDLSGRRRRKFSGNLPVPTVSTADFGEKTTSRIAVYIDTE
jgi:hypothetical protein